MKPHNDKELAKQFELLRREMLSLTVGGRAWSRKLTIRLNRKLIARLQLTRDPESMPYDYTFEPDYSVRLAKVSRTPFCTLTVTTATDKFILRVISNWLKSPVFEFERIDGTPLVAIDRTLRSTWWKNGFLTSASGNIQISGGVVLISQELPIEVGIATALYCDCHV